MYGRDLREFTDQRLADAAARAVLPSLDLPGPHSAALAGSALRRVTRIIIQRARVRRLDDGGELSLETQDELLEAVTLSVLHMAGALDALAIIHGLLAGESKYSKMGWQKEQFRGRVRSLSPAAASLFDRNSPGDRYLQAVLSLRNTVHRLMPDTGTAGRHDGDPAHGRAVLALERQSHPEIFEAFTKAGWTRFVGIELAGTDYLYLRPDTLVNLLLNDGVPLLAALINAVPTEPLDAPRSALDPDRGLYPREMRDYAVDYFGLRHLVAASSELAN
jgi:hypothetical protein